ncbi:hypothetical protein FG379_002218 [Cryptosporidium bovis]|uniref:uncharacterized protein n=1 Tax=Cryptosporidium bovis TaxID=310047 RepID=UPI00351A4BBB|nr:hypothetical protein FG379_002218 [Cryptosporidium bovis]
MIRRSNEYLRSDLLIKNYKVTNILGQGAYGVVYKAVNINEKYNAKNENINTNNINENNFAIKVFDKDLSKKGIHPSILREIGILKELSSHNFNGIIKLIDVIFENERIYAIYEYGGSSLQNFFEDKCNKNIINLQFGINVFFQIVNSVKFLHNLGIVHRDLKPENILLDNNNGKYFNIKIADFGLARSIRNHSHTNYTSDVVTIYYKSPELLDYSNNYNSFIIPFAIDYWSIGVIALELFNIIINQVEFNIHNSKRSRRIDNNKDIIWSPFFYEGNELSVLNSIQNFLNPNFKTENLKKVLLPLYESFPKIFHLISELLEIDPNKRCSCIYAFDILKEYATI